MPRFALSAGSLCAVLAFTLACGGALTEVNQDDLAELAVRVDQLPDSPEKAEVLGIIEEAYVHVHSGDMGLFAVSGFEIEVEDAIADGTITPAELAGLKGHDFLQTPSTLAPTAREAVVMQLHEDMSAAEGRMAAELSGWTNADLQAKFAEAGWSLDYCDQSSSDYGKENWCAFIKGSDGAWVYVTHYNSAEEAGWADEEGPDGVVYRAGQTVVDISVSKGEPSVALRDALVPTGEKIDALDRATLESRAQGLGWDVSDWYEDADAEMSYLAFRVSKGGLSGDVNIFDWKEAGTGEDRSVTGGTAYIEQGMDNVDVSIYDKAAAEALLAAFNGA